jgi:hypothetical protein
MKGKVMQVMVLATQKAGGSLEPRSLGPGCTTRETLSLKKKKKNAKGSTWLKGLRITVQSQA